MARNYAEDADLATAATLLRAAAPVSTHDAIVAHALYPSALDHSRIEVLLRGLRVASSFDATVALLVGLASLAR